MFSRVASASSALVLAASIALAHPPGHRGPAAPKQAQPAPPPGTGRNLQVLPRDIPQERLMLIMRHWSQALGVQCSYCHVPGNFRSDENPHKNIARGMVRMTNRINEELLPPVVGPSAEPRVNCYACHRGEAIPATQLPETKQGPPAHIAPDTPARPY
jgi:hypothetical protein